MNKLRSWSLPILTCAVMLAAVILPQRISLWRDLALLDTPHTEELQAENDLPTRPLSLLEQMSLVSLCDIYPESLTVVAQELIPDSETVAMIWTELDRLCDDGILAPEVLPADLSDFLCQRLYLRLPGSISGASFLLMEGYSKQEGLYFSLLLNEDGYTLRLELTHPAMEKYAGTPLDIGAAFFDRLGIEHSCVGYSPYEAVFATPDPTLRYLVSQDTDLLHIIPIPEGEISGSTDANVYDSSQSDPLISAQRKT